MCYGEEQGICFYPSSPLSAPFLIHSFFQAYALLPFSHCLPPSPLPVPSLLPLEEHTVIGTKEAELGSKILQPHILQIRVLEFLPSAVVNSVPATCAGGVMP